MFSAIKPTDFLRKHGSFVVFLSFVFLGFTIFFGMFFFTSQVALGSCQGNADCTGLNRTIRECQSGTSYTIKRIHGRCDTYTGDCFEDYGGTIHEDCADGYVCQGEGQCVPGPCMDDSDCANLNSSRRFCDDNHFVLETTTGRCDVDTGQCFSDTSDTRTNCWQSPESRTFCDGGNYLVTTQNVGVCDAFFGCTTSQVETHRQRCPDGYTCPTSAQACVPLPRLTVTKTGTGTGTVTSDQGGINCDPACSSTFNQTTTVTLTATNGTGMIALWSGCTPVHNDPRRCTVIMNHDRSVTATFNRPRLIVNINPPGGGTATQAGLHNYGTTVTSVATPNQGYIFSHWTGCTTVDGTRCSVFMNSDPRIITAHFTSLISNISSPTWVRQDSPFSITVTTARPSTCTLNPGNRTAGPGTPLTFDNLRQNIPVIYNIECTYTPATGQPVTDRETRRINVLPRFREF